MREVAISNYRILTPFTSPSHFSVVDYFLEDNLLKNLQKIMLREELYKFVDCWSGGLVCSTPVENAPTKKSILLYSDKNLTQLISQDVARHLEDILPHEYNVVPDLVRCDPGYCYPPHRDHELKMISIVVYLDDIGDATLLKTENQNVLVKWRKNRAVVFENAKHGIHWYKNTTNKYRYSLNIYITKEPVAFIVTENL